MSDSDFKKLLKKFGSGKPREQHTALSKLIALRKHHDAAKSESFAAGMDRLYQVASDLSCADSDRLLAVAILGRVASSIKGIRNKVHQKLGEILETPLPDPQLLEDVDDRAYIGKICTIVLPTWTSNYAARAAIIEGTGEKPRQAFLQALLKSTPDLDSALTTLISHLQDWTPETEDPGKSVAKRLRRILSALQEAMAETEPLPGEKPGRKLAKLIKASFAGVDRSSNHEAIFETSGEVAGVVHEMVRLRFSLATEASTYSALMQIKDLVPAYVWEKFAGKSKQMAMVVLDITEAMLILARQGIIDTDLATQLAIAAGSRKRSKAKMAKLAKSPGFSPEVKVWLAEGRLDGPDKQLSERGESQQLSDDAQLADLLVDTMRFQSAESVGREQILPEIEILTPEIGSELKRLLNYGLGLCDAINSMGRGRGLQVRGNPGDEEDYAPLDHELIDGSSGARRVRIIRPMVEQVREDGVAFVLRKGVAESVK